MSKGAFAIVWVWLFLAHAVRAEEAIYQIRMSGEIVGHTRYHTAREGDEMVIRTTVVFTPGRELNQEVKLTADTHLNAETFLPTAYRLSTYINGYTQSTIDARFEGDIVRQTIVAGGQNFDSEIHLPKPTYIADSNFRVDHYNIILRQYDFEQGGRQTFRIFTPLAAPQSPEAMGFTLAWMGGESIRIGAETYQADWFEGVSSGDPMEFWYDRASGRIVKWTIPSQEAEAFLSDDVEVGGEHAIIALQRDANLPRIPIDQDVGDADKLVFLQAHLNLRVIAEDKPPMNLTYQRFNGEIRRDGETIHINGVVTIQAHERSVEQSTPFPVQQFEPDDRFLGPTDKIESNHPDIQAKAKAVAAASQTTYEAVKAIGKWVAKEIRYDAIDASAYQCLSTGAGNALAKSRLAVAMLRPLNIPARLLGGVLYVGNQQCVSHHWLEAYLGDEAGWAPLDVITGELERFSASRVALWSGPGALVSGPSALMGAPDEIRILDFQNAAIPWQDLIPLQEGEQTRYRFTRDGQLIGESESRVKGVLTYRGIQSYEIESTLELGEFKAQDVMYLTFDGKPLFYHLKASANGDGRSVECIREGVKLKVSESGVNQTIDLPIGARVYFIDDDLPWQWDLMFRKQEFSTDVRREITVFNPRTRTLYNLPLVVEKIETIELAGKEHHCFRVNINGQIFWASSVGRLIRYEAPERKLVVELD